MKRIIDDANLEQKPVTLQVLKINTRATAFYQRLGFTIVDENHHTFSDEKPHHLNRLEFTIVLVY